ncbi:MAG: DNA alkylation repair protein [Desulfobacterales bacterium]
MPEIVLQELKRLSDVKYKAFNGKIVGTKQEVLGVRLPALKKIVKEIAKQHPDEFISADKI